DLNRVVRDVERLLRQAAGTTVALQVSLCEYPVRVRLDPSQFDQVILNLVLNARDAMPGGGTVRIETGLAEVPAARLPAGTPGHAGRYATLRVSDSGHGIAEADLPRLFEPFFTTKPPGRGTGLGLAMCHGIVRQAGGFIAVSSTPGQGASFDVHVPEAMAVETSPTTPTAHRPAGGTETVLVVEDEAAVRRFAARVLGGKGYRVVTATDGEQALALARGFEGALDLLLTDVSMPGISGRELAAALRAERPGIAVLYMSGYGEQALAEDGLVADGSPYLSKPFTAGVLASAVRETLDRRRSQIG
ncbi:MAG: response regulator, partial [Vicinamibacterales bacterium]|nr:response regulator [Vicinamibacterales bacterium]